MVAIQSLPAPCEPVRARPELRLIHGGRSPEHTQLQQKVYRRRRVIALVLAVALVVGVAVGAVAGLRVLAGGPGSGSLTVPASASSSRGAVAASVVPTRVAPDAPSVVVTSGDTLWGIARDITPRGGDVAATVDRLVTRNGGVAVLRPGMRLLLD